MHSTDADGVEPPGVTQLPSGFLKIRERVSPHLVLERVAKKIIFEDEDVHKSQIVDDVGPFGLCLFMDGYIQSAE